jgi:hypothetical protein
MATRLQAEAFPQRRERNEEATSPILASRFLHSHDTDMGALETTHAALLDAAS